MKKFFSLLLALLMLAIMLPMVALAEDEAGTPAGTDNNPVEVWTGFIGSKVASYASIEEAVENLGVNKWILIAKDYTLENDFTITDGVFLDVASGATLTVKEGVTLTVAANAKRLGIRDGGTIINNGTIMVCGTNNNSSKLMRQSNGTLAGKSLSVPNGYFLDNDGGMNNFFATEISKAVYEITFTDGTVKLSANSTNVTGNVKQVKLLADVVVGGWSAGTFINTDWVLDLNGHTISNTGADYTALNISNTKMTIKNGTVKYTGAAKGAIMVYGNAELTIAPDAVIEGGNGYGIFTSGTSNLIVYGEVRSSGEYAITGNGKRDTEGEESDKDDIDNCNITIQNGAVVSAPNGIAIYHPELGTVTINGGNITGHTGVEMCAGKLVVNGGNITSTGDNFDATGSQNAIKDGAAISIINRDYPGGIPTAEIKGGTIKATGTGAFAVKAYDYTNNTVADWETAPQHVTVTGGIFSGKNEAIVRLIPEGYVKNPYNDTDVIVKPSTITIIVPSTEETPKPAEDQKNPATGANDLVGVAAAAAVVALLGTAAVLRKK